MLHPRPGALCLWESEDTLANLNIKNFNVIFSSFANVSLAAARMYTPFSNDHHYYPHRHYYAFPLTTVATLLSSLNMLLAPQPPLIIAATSPHYCPRHHCHYCRLPALHPPPSLITATSANCYCYLPLLYCYFRLLPLPPLPMPLPTTTATTNLCCCPHPHCRSPPLPPSATPLLPLTPTTADCRWYHITYHCCYPYNRKSPPLVLIAYATVPTTAATAKHRCYDPTTSPTTSVTADYC